MTDETRPTDQEIKDQQAAELQEERERRAEALGEKDETPASPVPDQSADTPTETQYADTVARSWTRLMSSSSSSSERR